MIDYYLMFASCFLLSFGIYLGMIRAQNRKEREANAQFEMTLKSKGLKPDVEI